MYRLVIVILVFISSSAKAQLLGEYYFSDTTQGNLDYLFDHVEVEDGIIISGKTVSGAISSPIILKINPTGQVIWSTEEFVHANLSTLTFLSLDLFEDGFIYAVVYSGSTQYLWKINALTGTVIWVKPTITDLVFKNVFVKDYDTTTFLKTYVSPSNQNIVAFVNKATGNEVSSQTFNLDYPNGVLQVAVDENKNVIFLGGRELFKFNKDNLTDTLWYFDYQYYTPSIAVISQLYLDDYDQLFLFTRKSTSPNNSRVIRLDINTGKTVWYNEVIQASASLSDFVDINGKIYATYRHLYVGSSSYYYWTCKFDKETGVVDWFNNADVDSLLSGEDDFEQGPLSMDVDCNEDVYITGYFGDDNYGPKEWGILKLSGSTGDIQYKQHVDFDNTSADDWSIGKAVCVFENLPVILGHREEVPGTFEPVMVHLNPTSGQITYEHYLNAGYTFPSKTIDIQTYNNTIYVYKQIGEKLQVEAYDNNKNLLWQQNVADTSLLLGGHMRIDDNELVISYKKPLPTSSPPYYTNSTHSVFTRIYNRTSGAVMDSKTFLTSSAQIDLIELDYVNDTLFIFYSNGTNLTYRRVASSIVSAEQIIEPLGINASYNGDINIAYSNQSNKLFLLGQSSLYQINKSTLANSPILAYGSALQVYDQYRLADSLYISGATSTNSQFVAKLNLSTLLFDWIETYDNNGSAFKLVHDYNGLIYFAGKSDSISSLYCINANNGSLNWTVAIDSINYPYCEPMDLDINTEKNYIVFSGITQSSLIGSNAFIALYDLVGGNIYYREDMDDFNTYSTSYVSEILPDFSTWIGGGINEISKPQFGFIYDYKYGATNDSIQINACDSIISPSSNIYYVSGFYTDSLTTTLGCDSIIVMDLNIANTQFDTINIIAIDFYTSNSGIVYNQPGTYTEVFPSLNGCDSLIVINLSLNYTNLNSLNAKCAFILYPNPTSGEIQIVLNKTSDSAIFELFDVSGKKCDFILTYTDDSSRYSADLGTLSRGIYTIRLTVEGAYYFLKIVKE